MKKNHPTIYQVAAEAGVSIATVSRVINDPEVVNEKTRTTVRGVIDRLGYRPKPDMQIRAMKEYRRIGVLTPFFTAPSFVQRLRGVADALQSTHYELVIYTVDSADRLNEYLESLPILRLLDGLIVLSLPFSDHYADRLLDYSLETVVVEYPHRRLSSIEIDDEAGGGLAASYLFDKGYATFGFIGDTNTLEYSIHPINKRLQGFRDGLSKKGKAVKEEDILIAPYDMEKTRALAQKYLARDDHPRAVFSATDLQAVAVMHAARELGLRVPQDLAIIGFDDIDLADYVGLTTISQHLEESGRVAVDLLLHRLSGKNRGIQHINLPLEVIERETA